MSGAFVGATVSVAAPVGEAGAVVTVLPGAGATDGDATAVLSSTTPTFTVHVSFVVFLPSLYAAVILAVPFLTALTLA